MRINKLKTFNGDSLTTKKDINNWLSNQSESTEILSGQLNTDVIPIEGITPVNNQFTIDGTTITVNPLELESKTIKEKFDDIDDNINLIETSGLIGNTTSAVITGVIVSVYNSDKIQTFPTIRYDNGVSTISIPEASTEEQYTIIYKKKLENFEDDTDYSEYPLTFIAAEPNTKIKIEKVGAQTNRTIYYKRNLEDQWEVYTYDDEIVLSNIGDKVMFEQRSIYFSQDSARYIHIVSEGKFYARGQLMSLLNYGTSIGSYTFNNLFRNCDGILSLPLISATTFGPYCLSYAFFNCSNLIDTDITIEINNLTNTYAFNCMFSNCIKIKKTPIIHLNVIQVGSVVPINTFCYTFSYCSNLEEFRGYLSTEEIKDETVPASFFTAMFQQCGKLKIPPKKLHFTKFNAATLQYMFQNCNALEYTPEIKINEVLGSNVCMSMFENCRNLKTNNIKFNVSTLQNSAFQNMYRWCASLIENQEIILPENINNNNVCYQMFQSCYYLKSIKIIGAKTSSGSSAFFNMLNACPNLNKIEVDFTEWPSGTNTTSNWVYGVAPSGEFICPSALTETTGNNNIPSNWIITKK